jgi:hypothetical protein
MYALKQLFMTYFQELYENIKFLENSKLIFEALYDLLF